MGNTCAERCRLEPKLCSTYFGYLNSNIFIRDNETTKTMELLLKELLIWEIRENTRLKK